MPSRRYTSKRSFGTRFNDIKEGVEVSAKITPPDLISGDAVTFDELDINAVDATVINYGGIQASNFSQGAKIPSGESNQRVPSDLDDVFYWEQVTSGLLELHKQGFHNDEDIQNVEATSEGIYFTPTATEPARIYLTGRLPIPKSRKVYATWEADRSTNLRLIWWKNSHPVDVTHSSTTAGVATITTATAHGFSVGSEIRVTGLDVDYNGYHTITAVGTYSISYASPTLDATEDLNEDKWEVVGKVNLEDYVYEELTDKVQWDADYRSANVSNKVLTSNLATLTTNASHEFVVGDTVKVSDVDDTFNGTYKITAVTDTTLSYQKEATNVTSTVVSPAVQITSEDSTSATEYAVYVEVPAGASTLLLKSAKVFEVLGYGAKAPRYANVNNSSLTNNIATLTTDAPHNFSQDVSVVVSNVGAPYDGTHLIRSDNITSNSFTYTLINANLASTVANGKAVAYDRRQRSELTPDGLRLYQPDGTLAVDLTTSTSSVFNVYNEGNVVASIDYAGQATFSSIDADLYSLNNIDIIGDFANAKFNGFSYNQFNVSNVSNNEIETTNSYLNRLARGSIYKGYATPTANITLTTTNSYYSFASGYFVLEADRSYQVYASLGSMFANNSSDTSVQIFLRYGTGPISLAGSNNYVSRSTIGSLSSGTFHPIINQFDATSSAEKALVIGKRIESNVVSLMVSNPSSNVRIVGNNTNNRIGVIGVGNPYDGYWANLTWGTYATNSVSYTLPVSASNVLASNYTATTNIVAGQNGVFVSNTVGLVAGFPLTKVSGTGAFGSSAAVANVVNSTYFTTTVNHATNGSITFNPNFVVTNTCTSFVVQKLDLSNGTIQANTPIFYSLEALCTTPNVNVNLTFASSPANVSPITISVTDIGQAKNGTGSIADVADFGRTTVGSQAPEFGSSSAGLTVYDTLTFSTLESAYYDNYGRGQGTTDPYAYRYSIYQGNPGTASGTKKSAIRFPARNLSGLANVAITKAELYLRNRHSYLSSGLTCYIGLHMDNNLNGRTTAPTQSTANLGSTVLSTSFNKGQGKWITLPTAWHTYLINDIATGFLIGLTAAPNTWYSSLNSYGYFDGYTMSDPPILRISYQYTTTGSSGGGSGGGGYYFT